MTPDDVKRARALCERATSGPWTVRLETNVWSDGDTGVVVANCSGSTSSAHHWAGNASFIASARTLLPAALDALEEARRERDDVAHAFAQQAIRASVEHDRADRAEAALATCKAVLREVLGTPCVAQSECHAFHHYGCDCRLMSCIHGDLRARAEEASK